MNEQDMAKDNLIYKYRTGSNLYGTVVEGSDDDFGGIFIPNKDYVLGIKNVEQVALSSKVSKSARNQKGDIDFTIYSLTKFIPLAIANNPNIIETLFIPNSCILFINEFGESLRNNKHLFLSKKAYHTFKGYAYSQRRKLEVKRENMTGRTELADKFGYDTKFASHLIRLLLECFQILTEKTIEFPIPQHNMVRDIKIGKYELTWVIEKAEYLEKLVDEAYLKSDLQYSADLEAINKLQIELLETFWRSK